MIEKLCSSISRIRQRLLLTNSIRLVLVRRSIKMAIFIFMFVLGTLKNYGLEILSTLISKDIIQTSVVIGYKTRRKPSLTALKKTLTLYSSTWT